MIGEYVMTEHECLGRRRVPDPVALASYAIDSHITHRYVDLHGHVRNEGTLGGVVASPYGVSYRSIIPRRGQAENLLVPVCLSSTHAAYGSIRMEPVFMVLGQSAATAAALALDSRLAVQDIDYESLRQRLLKDQQILEWAFSPRRQPGIPVSELPGLVLTTARARTSGFWIYGAGVAFPDHVGVKGLDDDNADKGKKWVRFESNLDGMHEVGLAWFSSPDSAAKVPIRIRHAHGETVRYVDQRQGTKPFASLGTFRFVRGRPAVVTVETAGTSGKVSIDAVQFLKQK